MNGITILDIIIIILSLYFVIGGYNKGFIKQTSTILGIVFALVISMRYYNDFQPVIISYVNVSEQMAQLLSFAVLFILINVFVHIIGAVLKNILDLLFLKPFDHAAGAVLGLAKAFVLSYFLVLMIDQIPYTLFSEQINNSILAAQLLDFTPLIQNNLQNLFGP
ncbi:MAG: CvpA family protein [Halothermotrichaceae bacterium]